MLFSSTGPLSNPTRHEISLVLAIKIAPEESASIVDAYIGDWSFDELLVILFKVDIASHKQLLQLWFQRQKRDSLILLEDALTGLRGHAEQSGSQDLNNKISLFCLINTRNRDQMEAMMYD